MLIKTIPSLYVIDSMPGITLQLERVRQVKVRFSLSKQVNLQIAQKYYVLMYNIEHIGIAVKDASAAVDFFTLLFGIAPYREEIVESEGVRTIFFEVGGVKIELLEALHEQSPIAKFIDKKGEGIHHIALGTPDIENDLSKMQSAGIQLIHETPKEGADNKLISFLHPKSTHGVLIEFCQEKPASTPE